MHKALLTLLKADARVKTKFATRIWWLRRPQAKTALPACTLTQVGGYRDRHLEGASGLVEGSVQIDVWAATYPAAKEGMAAVLAVVNGYRNANGVIQGIFVEAERDLPDEEIAGSKLLFRVSADITVWFTE